MFTFRQEKLIPHVLGKGSYGKVFPYQSSPDDMRWVVKFLYAQDIPTLFTIIEEIVLGFSCEHPGILPIKGYSIQKSERTGYNIYIKLPRMRGDLREIIDKHKSSSTPIPEKKVIIYFYILTCALEYLHNKKNIVHRDIKPENILLNGDGWVRLSDIGGGKFVEDGDSILINTGGSTPQYLPPEILFPNQQDILKKNLFSADMWSLGVVMAEMMLLKIINATMQEKDLQKKLGTLNGKYNKVLIELVSSLLKINSKERMKVADVRKVLEDNFKSELEEFLSGENKLTEMIDKGNGQEGFMQRFTSSVKAGIITLNETFLTDNIHMKNHEAKTEKKFQDKWAKYFTTEIESLHVSIAPNARIKNVTLKDFMTGLEARIQEGGLRFEHFALDLTKCESITDTGLKYLGGSFKSQLSTLQTLKLNFANCYEIGDSGVRALSNSIGANLPHLSCLDLNFKGCKTITDQGIIALSKSVSTHNDNLEWLGLHFYGCVEVSDFGAQFIPAFILKKTKKIRRFEITLSYCEKITDKTIRDLSIAIGENNKVLQYLELNFVSCKQISDQGFSDLAIHLIPNTKSLHHLDVNFGVWDKVTDQGVKDVATHIEANLRNLPHIGLNLLDCKNVTDHGLITLMNSIGENLPNLEYFGLNISYFSQITNEGMGSISNNIHKRLKNLKSLDFNLSYCKEIYDEGISDLLSSIGDSLKLLNHLGLNLWSCKQITDQSINDFTSNLVEKLPRIRSLDLDFDCLSEISDHSVKPLLTRVRSNLKNLESLKLNFWNCPKVNDQVKNSLSILFKHVPQVSIRFK